MCVCFVCVYVCRYVNTCAYFSMCSHVSMHAGTQGGQKCVIPLSWDYRQCELPIMGARN